MALYKEIIDRIFDCACLHDIRAYSAVSRDWSAASHIPALGVYWPRRREVVNERSIHNLGGASVLCKKVRKLPALEVLLQRVPKCNGVVTLQQVLSTFAVSIGVSRWKRRIVRDTFELLQLTSMELSNDIADVQLLKLESLWLEKTDPYLKAQLSRHSY